MRFRLLALLMSAIGVLVGAGCADPVVFSEALQQGVGQKIYTQYNIWYTDPEEINCLNIQQGSFIPVGTEIEPVGTGSFGAIRFKDTAGHNYVIRFDSGTRLCTMRDFIGYTFTTTPPDELLKDIPPKTLERIRRGEVVAGMNRRDVLLAYGPPPAIRTPNPRLDTWLYWLTPTETVRVVFRGDKVRNVWNIND